MKNFDFIQTAANNVKNVNGLRAANKVYTSLNQVLKDIQRSDLMKAGYSEAFAAFGITEKVGMKEFFAVMQPSQYVEVKKGKETEKRLGLWGWKLEKDDNGEIISKTAVCRPVTGWTPSKVFKALSQARALADDKK